LACQTPLHEVTNAANLPNDFFQYFKNEFVLQQHAPYTVNEAFIARTYFGYFDAQPTNIRVSSQKRLF
jgi:hypothetical protein